MLLLELLSKEIEGILLIKYTTISTMLFQRNKGKPTCILMFLSLSKIVLFILSVTPFSWGVLRTTLILLMPFCELKSSNYLPRNLPQLSKFRNLILLLISFSINIFQTLNTSTHDGGSSIRSWYMLKVWEWHMVIVCGNACDGIMKGCSWKHG